MMVEMKVAMTDKQQESMQAGQMVVSQDVLKVVWWVLMKVDCQVALMVYMKVERMVDLQELMMVERKAGNLVAQQADQKV